MNMKNMEKKIDKICKTFEKYIEREKNILQFAPPIGQDKILNM